MSVQDETLASTQRAAVAALAKRYIAGKELDANVPVLFDSFGLWDELWQEQMLSCWSYLKEVGATAPVPEPQSYRAERKVLQATAAQRGRVKADLEQMKHPEAKEIADGPLTREEAHELISSIEQGTYDATKWTAVPF